MERGRIHTFIKKVATNLQYDTYRKGLGLVTTLHAKTKLRLKLLLSNLFFDVCPLLIFVYFKRQVEKVKIFVPPEMN